MEESQIDKKINYLRKKTDVDSLKKDEKELLKAVVSWYQKHNKDLKMKDIIFLIALSSNDDKRIQSIESTETYVYGTSKNLICKKEKVKRNNITKQYKNV